MDLNDRFVGIGFEYSHGQRPDALQLFNFPTGPVEQGDLAILSRRGTCKAIYNNFNLFFGVTAGNMDSMVNRYPIVVGKMQIRSV